MNDILNTTYFAHCIKQFFAMNYQSQLYKLSNTSLSLNFDLFQSQFSTPDLSLQTFCTVLISVSNAIICNVNNIPTLFDPDDHIIHSHIVSNLNIPHKCPTKLAFVNYKIYCQQHFVKPLSSITKFNFVVCSSGDFYTHYCKVNKKSTLCFCKIL